jgi:hypothetical protein
MRIKLNQNEIIEAQKIKKIDDNKELILYCMNERIHVYFNSTQELYNIFNKFDNSICINLENKR